MVGDVGLAEDMAQEALVAALEKWPETGVSDNPGAWLMAIAKNRAIDRLRREKTYERPAAGAGEADAARCEGALRGAAGV
jgi:predicted RNA polymerase sigma factor